MKLKVGEKYDIQFLEEILVGTELKRIFKEGGGAYVVWEYGKSKTPVTESAQSFVERIEKGKDILAREDITEIEI